MTATRLRSSASHLWHLTEIPLACSPAVLSARPGSPNRSARGVRVLGSRTRFVRARDGSRGQPVPLGAMRVSCHLSHGLTWSTPHTQRDEHGNKNFGQLEEMGWRDGACGGPLDMIGAEMLQPTRANRLHPIWPSPARLGRGVVQQRPEPSVSVACDALFGGAGFGPHGGSRT